MKIPPTPKGYNTINPFVITKDAQKFIEFVKEVFGAVERKEGFTLDTDGLVLHSELELGNSVLMCVETKPDWDASSQSLNYIHDTIMEIMPTLGDKK